MLTMYKTLTSVAVLSLMVMLGGLSAHAQANVNGSVQGTVGTTSTYATSTGQTGTGNTGTGGNAGTVGNTGTTAPGTPNTGAGSSAPMNIAVLSVAALVAIMGGVYLSRIRAVEKAR